MSSNWRHGVTSDLGVFSLKRSWMKRWKERRRRRNLLNRWDHPNLIIIFPLFQNTWQSTFVIARALALWPWLARWQSPPLTCSSSSSRTGSMEPWGKHWRRLLAEIWSTRLTNKGWILKNARRAVDILRKHCSWTRDNDEKWDFLLVVDKIYPFSAVQPFGQLRFFASLSLLTFVSPQKYFSKLLWYPTYTNICLRSWAKVFNLAKTFYSSHTSISWTSVHFFACDILASHDLLQLVKSSERN